MDHDRHVTIIILLILSLQRMHPHRSIFYMHSFSYGLILYCMYGKKSLSIQKGVVYAYYILLIISVIYRKLMDRDLMACILMSRYVIVFFDCISIKPPVKQTNRSFIKIVRPMVPDEPRHAVDQWRLGNISICFFHYQINTLVKWKPPCGSIKISGRIVLVWPAGLRVTDPHHALCTRRSLIVIGIVMILMRKKINQRIFFFFFIPLS